MKELEGRVPSLDGLRAISILMVVVAHATITCGAERLDSLPNWTWWLFNGELGVQIFFVISGFIITLLLLKEEKANGRISLSGFYKRRAVRILPPFFAVMLAVIAIDLSFDLPIHRNVYVAAFTFTTGWWKDSTWLLGHIWSLSVEEQFYLLWPLIFLLTGDRATRYKLLIGAVILFPIMRVGVYISPLVEQRSFLIITKGDSILAGCALAMLLFYDGQRAGQWLTTRASLIGWGSLVALVVVIGLQSNAAAGILTVPFANLIGSIAIACLMGIVILNKGVLYNILNSRPFVFVGTVSYSWYLWQQLFLVPCGRYDEFEGMTFPLNIILSFAAAVGSYYLIERPSRKLRDA